MTCVIIEDLKVAADYLKNCCKKSGEVEVKGVFPNVPTALEFLNEHNVDLLFLDVEMPGATGFDLLDQIAYHPKVILTTSKEEYAYNAFQYHVSDFLKKPFTYQRFLEALERVKEKELRPEAAETHLYIRSDNKLVRLNYDDILYIESMGDYVRFVTKDKKYVTYNTLKKLEGKISSEHFIQVHRRYIVNLHKIDDIRENDLFIRGIEIPIGKTYRAEVMKKLTIL